MNIQKKYHLRATVWWSCYLGGLLVLLLLLVPGPLMAVPGDTAMASPQQVKPQTPRLTRVVRTDCLKRYPNPRIRFDHKDAKGRIYIPVINWAAYDNSLFRKAPKLPPCGLNKNSSRTWVDIYDAATNNRIYGFCAFNSKDDLKKIWFMPKTKSGKVYIILNDRACKRKYRSNTISYGAVNECRKRYPKPKIRFDHKDAKGRIYIPVVNWTAYDNSMFRKAPKLPPCGLNKASSRTWVDIFDAKTNNRIYGFCAFDSKDDLKKIWFLPKTRTGKVYIVLKDRLCKRMYRSNTIRW